jgi:integrase
MYRTLAPRTRELYADLLRLHIVPHVGSMPLGKLTPAEVRRWHSDRLANTGPVRTRQAYSLLRTILGTAVKDELLASNPCSIRGAGQARSPERPFVSRDQADALAAALPADMRVLLVVTLWAHLRVGELLALRRGDVNLPMAPSTCTARWSSSRPGRRSLRPRPGGGGSCTCQSRL